MTVLTEGAAAETGTWVPAVEFGGTSTGITYGTQIGRYVRMGNLVYIEGSVVLTNNGSATGAMKITGIPFSQHLTQPPYPALSVGNFSGFTGLEASGIRTLMISDAISLYDNTTAAITSILDTNTTNTATVHFSGTYEAAQ